MAEAVISAPDRAAEEWALKRAQDLIGLLWHVGVYVILTLFFVLLDLFVGQEGIQWAIWVVAFWGLGLAFHVLAWFVDGRQIERRLAQRYLEKERR